MNRSRLAPSSSPSSSSQRSACPDMPRGFRGKASDQPHGRAGCSWSVTLRWTASASKGVGGYRVYRQCRRLVAIVGLGHRGSSMTGYVDAGLTNGTSYADRVATRSSTATPPHESAPSVPHRRLRWQRADRVRQARPRARRATTTSSGS